MNSERRHFSPQEKVLAAWQSDFLAGEAQMVLKRFSSLPPVVWGFIKEKYQIPSLCSFRFFSFGPFHEGGLGLAEDRLRPQSFTRTTTNC